MPFDGHVIVSPMQIRMARAALQWTVQQLAEHAGVGERTIRRLETDDNRNMQITTYERIVRTLEESGVIFVPASEGIGAGVRSRYLRGLP